MNLNALSDFLFALEQIAQPLWFWIVQGAVFTTATALLIIVFKLIFKNRISAKWHFLVWGILLIRLVFPVLPSAPFSVFNFAKMDEQSVTSSSVVNIVSQEGYYRQSDEPRYSLTFGENAVPDNKADDDGGVYYNTNVHAFRFGEFFAVIWTVGALLLSVYFIIVLIIYRRGLKKKRRECDEKTLSVFNSCKEKLGIKRTVRLYFADATPVLTGIFRPSIYIPDSYSEHELEAVLIHELCHLKHLDVLWSGVAAAVLCLNWYNPVIWVSFFMFKRDIELYCDERTLKFTGNKQSYAKLLLKTATKNRYVLGTSSLQSGKSDVKRRIRFLAKFKKPKVIIIVIAVVLAAVISVGCLTNAYTEQPEQNTPYAETTESSIEKTSANPSYSYDASTQIFTINRVGEISSQDIRYKGNIDIDSGEFIDGVGWIPTIKSAPNSTTEEWRKTITGTPKIIEIGEGVTRICAYTFEGGSNGINCGFENTEDVVFPSSLERIDEFAFAGCTKLSYADLPENLTTIGDGAFFKCSSLESVIIPNGVDDIGKGAFSCCESLKDVSLGGNIVAINDYAFYKTGLKSIDLTKSYLCEIGECAFYGCDLTEVTIPESVFSIREKAFGYNEDGKIEGFIIKGCKGTPAETYAKQNGFTFVEVDSVNPNISYSYDPETMTLSLTGQGDMNDYEWTPPWRITNKIETINVGKGITSLCSDAFDAGLFDPPENGNYGTQYTEHVNLPDSLRKIGSGAFSWNFSLTNIELPENLTEIDNAAFIECINLKSLEIPDGVTTIHGRLCYGCKAFESVKLGKNTEMIEDSAFEGTSLKHIDIPNTVTSIGQNVFYNCKLTSVTVPKSVVFIDNYAFGYVPDPNGQPRKIDNFTIKGYKGTEAETYAKENGFKFEEIK